MNQPILTLRQDTPPYSPVSNPLPYSETVAKQSGLPILAGDNSDTQIFRLYNNFALAANIASAVNVTLMAFDDSSGSNTAVKSVTAQNWLTVYQSGSGEGSSAPGGIYSFYNQQPTAIGGQSIYIPPYGSNASNTPGLIRAGSSNNGCGFVQVKSYVAPSLAAGMATWTFALVVQYDWSP